MAFDWMIVGLGNPGAQYARHRHNIGFMVLDTLYDGAWKNKFKSDVAEITIGGQRCLLVKPHTFMNLSGEAVQPAMEFYKIPKDRIAVIHDELDIPPGHFRIKLGGGAGGHNGIKSIDQHLGSPNYWRLRCGIGHPGIKDMVSPYVLSNFSKEEQNTWLPDFLGDIAKNLPLFLNGDAAKMTAAVKPPAASATGL